MTSAIRLRRTAIRTIPRLFVGFAALAALGVGAAAAEPTAPPKSETAAGPESNARPNAESNPASESVTLDQAAQTRLGIEVVALESAHRRPTSESFARVLDPAPLVELDAAITDARAGFKAAKAEAERTEKLFEEEQNVSAKVRDAARAELVSTRARLDSARRRLALEWGSGLARLEDSARARLIDRLAKGDAALVRIELPLELDPSYEPSAVALLPRLANADGGSAEVAAHVIGALTAVDPRLQSRALLARADAGSKELPVGRVLAARLPTAEQAVAGVVLPRGALLRSGGARWVFVRTQPTAFERRKVEGGEPVDDGWFVAHGFAPGELVVRAGAADLLAAEHATRAEAASDEEDED